MLTQKNKLNHYKKNTKTNPNLTKYKFKNCSHLCACRCAQMSYTTQHRAFLTIFPLYLQTTTVAQMLPIRGEDKIIPVRKRSYY